MTRTEPSTRRAGRRTRARRLFRQAVAMVVVIPLLGLGYFAGLAAVVSRDVRRVEVLRPDGPEILVRDDPAQTYLLVGTGVGTGAGAPDVTTVVLHVPSEEARAVAVVLPARSYVDVPLCRDGEGTPVEPFGAALESVLSRAGAGCLLATVQQLTGLAIEHYVQFDVSALTDVVASVGEVTVCLPTALAGIGLPAGSQPVDGPGALALLRTPPDDSLRQVQVQLLGAIMHRVGAASRVLHPVGTTRMLSAAAHALTLDTETGWGDLQRLVRVLRGLGSEQVGVLASPLRQAGYRPADGSAAVDLVDAQASRELFAALSAEAAPSSAVATAAGRSC